MDRSLTAFKQLFQKERWAWSDGWNLVHYPHGFLKRNWNYVGLSIGLEWNFVGITLWRYWYCIGILLDYIYTHVNIHIILLYHYTYVYRYTHRSKNNINILNNHWLSPTSYHYCFLSDGESARLIHKKSQRHSWGDQMCLIWQKNLNSVTG